MQRMKRIDALKFISGHIIQGKGIKIQLDGETLRLQFSGMHHIWHNDNGMRVVAVIDTETFTADMSSEWAEQLIEFYD